MTTKTPTIAQLVAEHIDELKGMGTHQELAAWADEHDLMTQQRFPRFKKALLEHGVDYVALRRAPRVARRGSVTHEITVYSDAKASAGRFCICDQDGEPVWYGRDFDDNDEQSAAEMAAAKKAVWLAGKVRDQEGVDTLRLNLKVDAQWLCHANGDSGGGKAKALRAAADKAGIVLNVDWVAGTENPADENTTGYGYMRWQEGIDQIAVAPVDSEEPS